MNIKDWAAVGAALIGMLFWIFNVNATANTAMKQTEKLEKTFTDFQKQQIADGKQIAGMAENIKNMNMILRRIEQNTNKL